MLALRQIRPVKNHTVTIKLPLDFLADQVEVIILPAPAQTFSPEVDADAAAASLHLSVDTSRLTEVQHRAYERTQMLLKQGRKSDEPRILGLFSGLVQISDDFDEPLPDEDLYWGEGSDEYGVSLKR